MGQTARTTELLFDLARREQGGANTQKRHYLEETIKVLDAARAFYLEFFLAHPEKLLELEEEGERLRAFLPPDHIPEELLLTGLFQESEACPEGAADPGLLDKAIALLGIYSLVRRNAVTKTLSLHRLSEQEHRAWRGRLLRLLNRVFPPRDISDSIPIKDWPWCECLLPHVAWITTPREPEDYPLEAAALAHLFDNVGA